MDFGLSGTRADDDRAVDTRILVPVVQGGSPAPERGGYGWLAAVIPVSARRLRATDHVLAVDLEYAGAELVDERPDVEIVGGPDELRGDAGLAVVVLDPPVPGDRRRLNRAVRRVGTALRTGVQARRAQRELVRSGYSVTTVIRWDVGHRAALPGVPAPAERLQERIPGRALVIGRRSVAGAPTALDAAVRALSERLGSEQKLEWASIRAGLLVAAANGAVLRVAIGRGRRQIASQSSALGRLGVASAPDEVSSRIPQLLGHGGEGLAEWSFERLMPGRRPSLPFGPAFARDCVDFLVALHALPGGGDLGAGLVAAAAEAARVCDTRDAGRLDALAHRLETELAHVSRGFGHGDFFAGNLLSDGGRLTAVLDWDAGGPGCPALLDLLHLHLTSVPYGLDHDWGPAVVERLLPFARRGGDESVARYCAAVGLEPDPDLLRSLVLAYWLRYVAYQLRTHPSRQHEELWIEHNVCGVLHAVDRLVPA